MRQTRWVEAAPIAQALVQTYPDDPNWRYLLGVTRWRLEDPIAAIQALREAENRGMDTSPLHKALGLAYYSINQFILFEMQMDKASKLAPLDFEPIYSLGRYRESILNDYSGALKFFERATLLKPDHSKSVYYKGHCQEMLDMWPEALGTFQSAIVLVERTARASAYRIRGWHVCCSKPRRHKRSFSLKRRLNLNRIWTRIIPPSPGSMNCRASFRKPSSSCKLLCASARTNPATTMFFLRFTGVSAGRKTLRPNCRPFRS